MDALIIIDDVHKVVICQRMILELVPHVTRDFGVLLQSTAVWTGCFSEEYLSLVCCGSDKSFAATLTSGIDT